MKLREMRFVADENIDEEVVKWLRSEGIDVIDLKEQGLLGMEDANILKMANAQQRVVISQDSDFGTMIFRDSAPVYGILFVQPGHMEPSLHVQTMKTLLTMEQEINLEIPFILVAENNGNTIKIRIRNL